MKESIRKSALIISFGTLFSKFGGMTRELVIASAFGIGAAYDAYNYSYVIPGFFLILIGGINGPIHNAVVTVLSKKENNEAEIIINTINISIGLLLFIISAILFIFSSQFISIIGPGLNQQIHDIAATQLQIMSPIIFLSGLIGVGFGALNSRRIFFITSASPIISSLSIIIGVCLFLIFKDSSKDYSELAFEGGIILAQATLIGAILQWMTQIPLFNKKGLLKFNSIINFNHPGVKEIWKIIAPASLSSGMLQINVFTDLFFASSISGAAAGLGYATFLVQAPIGIISNALLLPLLPIFSRLISLNSQKELISLIRKSIIICSGIMIAIGSIFISLGPSIVGLIYGRGAFDYQAINLVSGLLIVYGIGMPAYLCRDLLVRVFYSFGDGITPFKFSVIGIVLNLLLDWTFIGGPTPWGLKIPINLGVKGLVLATVGVNLVTCIMLLLKLNSNLALKLQLNKLFITFLKLILCGLISGIIGSQLHSFINVPNHFLWQSLRIILSSTTSIFTFLLTTKLLRIKEINRILSSKGRISS